MIPVSYEWLLCVDERTCQQKRGYNSEKLAGKFAELLGAQHNVKNRAEKCLACHRWHLRARKEKR